MTDYSELLEELEIFASVENDCGSPSRADLFSSAKTAVETLTRELDRERMRLVACGIVALSDTPESAAKARDMHPDYRSASCDDVARRVDECMTLRAELTAAKARLAEGVQHAYEEGWNDGASAVPACTNLTSSSAHDWEGSMAKAALAKQEASHD